MAAGWEETNLLTSFREKLSHGRGDVSISLNILVTGTLRSRKSYSDTSIYKDHPDPRNQQTVVLIHRRSVGSIAWRVYLLGPVKCGLYKQVVFMYRWSLG